MAWALLALKLPPGTVANGINVRPLCGALRRDFGRGFRVLGSELSLAQNERQSYREARVRGADQLFRIGRPIPLERVNGGIPRRTDVVGVFPNEAAIVRPVGTILLEQNDEWAVQRARYMTLETIAPLRDDAAVNLPALAG
jgi:hypothetical protein